MCGIVCAFDGNHGAAALRDRCIQMARRLRHRGPDWSGIYSDERAILAHERLAIVDPASGKQPLYSEDGKLVLAANGEIYNHAELRKQFEGRYNFQTASDCEVILALYRDKGASFLDEMNGIFAFALYDADKDEYLIARDHIGIIPLYMGWDSNGTFYVGSELKSLEGVCTKIELFPPGHYLSSKDGELVRWYERDWTEYEAVKEAGRCLSCDCRLCINLLSCPAIILDENGKAAVDETQCPGCGVCAMVCPHDAIKAGE